MVVGELTGRGADSDGRLSPPAGFELRHFGEAGLEVSRVFLVDRNADYARRFRIADLHHRVVVDLRIKTEKRGNGEVLALFVETVAGVAAGVVFVLGEGVGVAIADVDSDIAVIARELGGNRASSVLQCFGR